MAKEILIADPDKIIQEEFERIFETSGHHILFTPNDEEALLRGRLFKPDLIIGGKDLCRAVRNDMELEGIPFIILLDMFEDLSEKERKILRADGMISRPLDEDEVLGIVNHLIEEERPGDERAIAEDVPGWKSLADIKKAKNGTAEEFSLDVFGENEEEIIELVDVVEEPESRMSIDDFALQHKDVSFGEIAPIESWEKIGREAEEKGIELEEPSLRFDEGIGEQKASQGDELFEKVDLEEILRKVERLKPSIEKEWPAQMKEKIPEEAKDMPQEVGAKYTAPEEFEATLRDALKVEAEEESLRSFFTQETKQEAPGLLKLEETPEELELQELSEEEFPEAFLEELSEELKELKEEELVAEEMPVEAEAETTEEEEISELFEEEIEEQGKELAAEVRMEALSVAEKVTPEEELSELFSGEVQSLEQALEETVSILDRPPAEELVTGEEMASIGEIASAEEFKREEVELPEVAQEPEISLGKIPPSAMHLDRKIEEVITRGVQEMMQDFMTKVIPEMAEHMIIHTMERIETMVKQVVPDLAEKAIQEEIQRLQKEEKD